MPRIGFTFLVSCAACVVANVAAADPRSALYDWRGFYAGVHAGAGLDLADVKDPFGGSIYGDTVRAPGALAGGQLGYNWQIASAVLGLEAEASWADMDGTDTCFAYSGFYFSSNCHAHVDALGTLTGRLGWALANDGRTLLYGKAGLAWKHASTDAYVNRETERLSTGIDEVRWGFAVGGGIERALSNRWSFKTEYDFLGFGDEDFAAPKSHYQTVVGDPGTIVTIPQTATSVASGVHQLKVGLNYRFGEGDAALDPGWGWGALPSGAPSLALGTELEIGARYVRGWGRFQKDMGHAGVNSDILASRLTYEGMTSDGQEAFARLDAPFDLMVKGVMGSGSGGSDQMNDEDWNLGPPETHALVPYSNSWSAADYKIRYATVDVGYDVWRSPQTKVAPFIGYSYFKQDMTALGCIQIADQHSDCAHPPHPTSVLLLSDVDTWKSLRLGAVIDTDLAPRLKISVDAAYLPNVEVSAVNRHFLRNIMSPEWGDGTGVQLDAILSYALTDELSLGVGGRYWSMWTTSGATNFAERGTLAPMRFAAEQAALLVQGSYTFGAAPAAGRN